MFSVWGDIWYITYLKTIGFALLGLTLMVILSRIWDKYQNKKKAPGLLQQSKRGTNESIHSYYNTKGEK
ncbi:hypothetical protein [Garciella nitratireducens]|uniref:Uncharacterized protein n=1 Tax=Garciella nitratireducens DSM 15102 TaxID=1121911 RepID=A0A1T4K783_9FIRM|nr:hypothetical protein [Garciella nitratireducens]SJZ38318.1 hypothetical protein SAMN02745973_00394 [Garciella nitratireducens DSM 15102]